MEPTVDRSNAIPLLRHGHEAPRNGEWRSIQVACLRCGSRRVATRQPRGSGLNLPACLSCGYLGLTASESSERAPRNYALKA
jgi:hypothetical protein